VNRDFRSQDQKNLGAQHIAQDAPEACRHHAHQNGERPAPPPAAFRIASTSRSIMMLAVIIDD
jgi:hypothetical protein